MTGVPTKERILDAAETLMLGKSFHSVGLNEILAAVRVPKGSFYHYFESKEQFGVEMLKHYVAHATAFKRGELLHPATRGNALKRLLGFFEKIAAKCRKSKGRFPCLLVKLNAEVADFSEPMRRVLEEGNRQGIALYAELLREGIARGEISAAVPPSVMAAIIQDLWTGALQRAATQRNAAPVRQMIDYLKTALAPS